MSEQTEAVETYAYLWQDDVERQRWVIWHTAGPDIIFDRETNCPVDIDDEAVLHEVLRRMREAGVPESDDYPGGPCA